MSAQDYIVLRNAEEIEGKVSTVAPDKIVYQKWSNPDGPSYEIDRSDVLFIRYQNGEKEVFEIEDTKDTHSMRYNVNKKIRFQSYMYIGADFFSLSGGPTYDVSLGARMTDYFYLGVETGFHTMVIGGDVAGYIPVGLNMKGYIPVTRKVMPYANCTLPVLIVAM